jgi:hypothetical protein
MDVGRMRKFNARVRWERIVSMLRNRESDFKCAASMSAFSPLSENAARRREETLTLIPDPTKGTKLPTLF